MSIAPANARFADDAPKSNPWMHDGLGYSQSADHLAKALVGIDAPHGYVVGLHGAWGSGKSTFLNFVEAFMKKRQQEDEPAYVATQLIRFEPWIVSGYQDLAAAFFKQLSLKIADQAARRAAQKSRIGKMLKLGVDPVLDSAAVLGATIDHTAGVASRSAATAAKKGVGAAIDKWLEEPSLQASYEQLVERLRADGRRFVVMIDDIDRLTTQEIRSIMQMVKTVGRLPNVIYLLAYDRDVVWASLNQDDGGAAQRPHFAEKIIQHEIELPVPSRHALMVMLEAEIRQLPAAPAGSMRWYDLLQVGIHRWIRRPRDVARLANAVRFAWPALAGEIDPQDLLCMEGLRLFDRDVYDWVRDQRDLLLRQGFPRLVSETRHEEIGQALSESLPADKREDILSLLAALFPTTPKLFTRKRISSYNEQWHQVASRRGIATKAAFDAYFSLAPSVHEIPKSLIDRAMAALDDEDAQLACIAEAVRMKDAFGNTLIGDYLQELLYRFADRANRPTQALFNAMLKSGEGINRIEWNGDIFVPSANLHILIVKTLQILGEAKAARLVEESLAKPGDLPFKCALLVHQARELGLIEGGGNSREPALSATDIARLGELLAAEVEVEVRAGALDDAYAYYDILRLLAFTGRGDQALAWSRHLALSNPHRLATLSDGLLSYSRNERGKNYGMGQKPDAEIYDVDALETGIEQFALSQDLNDDERARLIAVQKWFERGRQGEGPP